MTGSWKRPAGGRIDWVVVHERPVGLQFIQYCNSFNEYYRSRFVRVALTSVNQCRLITISRIAQSAAVGLRAQPV